MKSKIFMLLGLLIVLITGIFITTQAHAISVPTIKSAIIETHEGQTACEEAADNDPVEAIWYSGGNESPQVQYGRCNINLDEYISWGAEEYFEPCASSDLGCAVMLYWIKYKDQ